MRCDPLIIGGGPAGAAAAIRLGLAGRHPMLFERSAGPVDKVCGDFLSADALERLDSLGIDPVTLGAASIRSLRLIHRDRVVQLELPFAAAGLSRRVLDAALLQRAAEKGARVCLGWGVRRIERERAGWLVHTTHGEPVKAADVFLATGKHDLRALPRPGAARGAVGMKMYLQLTPAQTAALAGVIALILFPGGYAGLQCIEDRRAVLCVALARGKLQAVGGTWAGVLAYLTSTSRHFGEILAGATPLLVRPLAIAGVPYGFLHRQAAAAEQAGLFRLGDQAAVIPSLAGDGIAIALHSGASAARCWLNKDAAAAYHRGLARDLGGQLLLARLLHRTGMTGWLQGAAVRGGGWWPGLLRQAAHGTRLNAPVGG